MKANYKYVINDVLQYIYRTHFEYMRIYLHLNKIS